MRESGTSTDVVEKTNEFQIGAGQITSPVDGTSFVASFGRAFMKEIDGNDSPFVAQNLDLGDWATHRHDDIQDSQSIPHITVIASGDDTADYYKFNLDAASRVVVDLDNGYKIDDSQFWNPVLRLLRAPDMFVVHESYYGFNDTGSDTYLDPYFDFNDDAPYPAGDLAPGEYVIEVANEFGGIPDGVDYDLHFSVEGHKTASFLFQPDPVGEDETAQTPAQNIDTFTNFGTFYDPAVGYQDIDYNVPYAQIVGDGDGTFDTFEFQVTPSMLNPVAGTISGTKDSSNYYTAVDLNLNQTGATTAVGDTWSVNVNGTLYSYVSQASDSLTSVASGLKTAINNDTAALATYAATSSSSTVSLGDPRGFRVSDVTQQVQIAGTTKRLHETNAVQFDSVNVTLGGSITTGETWALKLGGATYSYQVEASVTTLSALAAKLRDAISGYTVSVSDATLTISRGTPFTADFEVSGVDPQGTASISGTPDQSTLSGVSFSTATVTLGGTVRPHETWAVTLDGTAYTYKTQPGDSTTVVAAELKKVVPATYAPVASTNTLQLTKSAGFTVGYSVTPGTAGTAAVESAAPTTNTFELTGAPATGEKWVFDVDGSKFTHTATGSSTLASIATAAASHFNGLTGYTAAVEGNTVAVVKLAGSMTATHYIESPVTDGATFAQQITFASTAPANSTWTISVNGTEFSSTAASSRTATQLASALAGLVNADSNLTASASGGTILIQHDSGTTISVAAESTPGSIAAASAQSARQVTLSGSPAATEDWTLTVDGTPFTHSVSADTTAANVAAELATLVNANAAYTAFSVGAEVTVLSNSASITMTVDDDAAGTVDATISGSAGFVQQVTLSGGATTLDIDATNFSSTGGSSSDVATELAGLVNGNGSYAATANGDVLTIVRLDGSASSVSLDPTTQGTVASGKRFTQTTGWAAGSTWSVTVDSNPAVSDSSSASSLASKLSALSGITAVAHNNTVIVLKTSGAAVTVGAALAPTGGVGTTAASKTITLGGAVAADEVWNIQVGSTAHSTTVGSSDSLADVLSRLVSDLNDDVGYTASFQGNAITLTKLSGAVDTIVTTITPPATEGAPIASGTPLANWKQQISLNGPVGVGDVWSWVLDTESETSYTVVAANDTLAKIATGIAGVMSAQSGYTATASGNVVTVSATTNQPVRVKSVKQQRVQAATFESATADTRDHYLNANITLQKTGGRALNGEQWSVTVHGKEYLYTVSTSSAQGGVNKGVTLSTVAAGLADVVKADYPNASSSGSTISIPSPELNGATVQVSRGNGTVRAVFDIDGGGTTKRDATFTADLFSVVYTEYVTSTILILTDDAGNELAAVYDPADPNFIDIGSETALDALLTHSFNAAGTYQIHVGTCRHTVDSSCVVDGNVVGEVRGVVQDLTYTLNVSLENHQTGAEVTELNGKTIKITSGPGEGSEAKIASYDPESSLFTIEDVAAGSDFAAINDTSVFTIFDNLVIEDGSAYSAILTDSYEVVLTSPPASDVTVYVVPEITRTFNSKLVFTTTKGQNDALQVEVDPKPEVTPLPADDGRQKLVFTPDNWNVPQTVMVTAVDDNVADGQDAATFPAFVERVAGIRGPLSVKGGEQNTEGATVEEPFLLAGETNYPKKDGDITGFGRLETTPGTYVATLSDTAATHVSPEDGPNQSGFDPRINESPYEFIILTGDAAGLRFEAERLEGTDTVVFTEDWPEGFDPTVVTEPGAYYFGPLNANFDVDEEDQVDVVEVFNRESISTDSATLTADRLTGLGMGPDTVIAGETVPGGLRYSDIEELDIRLGAGVNHVTIESTHTGTTNITTQAAADRFDIENVFGHTTIDAGDGVDHFEIGNAAQRVDQIAGLLTINGQAGDDTAHVNDTGDRSGDSGTLTPSSITGLNMPLIPAVQTIRVRAVGGNFQLTIPDSQDTEGGNLAPVTIPYDASAEVVQVQLTSLFGLPLGAADIVVDKLGDAYEVTLGGELAGVEQPELIWADADSPGLVAGADASVEVRVESLREGSQLNAPHTVQTLTVSDTAGEFKLRLLGQESRSIAPDADEQAILWAINSILNPNNPPDQYAPENWQTHPDWTQTEIDALTAAVADHRGDKPYTRNVAVHRNPGSNLIKIEFRGEHRSLQLSQSDVITVDPNDVVLRTRVDGIDYSGLTQLDIDLGSGNDIFNVQGTYGDTITNVNAHDGNDSFQVSSAAADQLVDQDTAPGHLDKIEGDLNLDAGAGTNSLFVSDNQAVVGDPAVWITDNRISGLAPADITYTSPGGNFDAGLSIWAGTGADNIEIVSVDTNSQTITTLYTAGGADDVRVEVADPAGDAHLSLVESIDRRLRIRTQGGADVIDASQSTLAMRLESGADEDIVKAGHNDDIVHAGDGSDIVFGGDGKDYISAITDLPGGAPTADSEVVFGDHGRVVYNSQGSTHTIDSIEPTAMLDSYRPGTDTLHQIVSDSLPGGDDDTIYVGDGNNVALGGQGRDQIVSGGDDDLLFGDLGDISFDAGVLVVATSSDTGTGGGDTISAGSGRNVIVAGVGEDNINTGADRDYVIGDNGQARFYASGTVQFIRSTVTNGASDSIVTADDRDFVIGGALGDVIGTGSDDADDAVISDFGELDFDAAGKLTRAISTDPYAAANGDDEVYTQEGADVVIGGGGNDRLVAGADDVRDSQRDVVLGDFGTVTFDGNELPLLAESTFPSLGGNDVLTLGGGDDVAIAGMADDIILAHSGDDIAFGDSAHLTFANGEWMRLESIGQTYGGYDQILASTGDDIVVGGADGDVLLGGAHGDDVLLGDNGIVVGNDGSSMANDILTTGYTDGGGDDKIQDDDGLNILIGGDGDDNLSGGAQRDWIAGDYVDVIRDATFAMEQFVSTDEAKGGSDGISGQGGFDVIVAGAMSDTASGNTGRDVVIGDNARVLAHGDNIYNIRSIGSEGDDDTLHGDADSDVLFGGQGGDTIDAGLTGDDVVVGDNALGSFRWLTLTDLTSIDPSVGGDDTIHTHSEDDIVIAGLGNDTVDTGSDAGADFVVGDHGQALFDIIGAGNVLREIKTLHVFHAGADTIYVGEWARRRFGG